VHAHAGRAQHREASQPAQLRRYCAGKVVVGEQPAGKGKREATENESPKLWRAPGAYSEVSEVKVPIDVGMVPARFQLEKDLRAAVMREWL